MVRIRIRVNEDFKIVVEENDGVALGLVSPDFIAVKHGCYVKVLVIQSIFARVTKRGSGMWLPSISRNSSVYGASSQNGLLMFPSNSDGFLRGGRCKPAVRTGLPEPEL